MYNKSLICLVLSHALLIVLCIDSAVVSETLTLQEPTGCAEAFKGRCRCGEVLYNHSNRYVTNCTNTNFSDVSMLTQLSPETEILIFTGNNVTSLPANVIGQDAKYERLHTIDLSNNHIRFIRGKTFHNVKTVKILNLSHNHIVIDDDNFHPRLFSNFKTLEELHLQNAFAKTSQYLDFMSDLSVTFNESALQTLKLLNLDHNYIQAFPSDDVFCVMPSLEKLYLSNNYLTDFTLNLTCLKHLNLVDLSYNFIKSLDKRSLAYLETGPKLYNINLFMNPFRCDCASKDFFEWTKNTTEFRIESVEKFRCSSGYPQDNAGKYFDELSLLDLECVSPLRNDDFYNYVTYSYAILTSLIITLLILVGALVFTNRQHIINSWTYLTTGIAQKREYTSLEKEMKRHNQNQEVAEVEV